MRDTKSFLRELAGRGEKAARVNARAA